MSPAVLTCVLTLLTGLAQAQQAVPATATTTLTGQAGTAASAPPAPAPMPAGSTRTSSLRELGIDYEITLRGVQGSAGVPFSVRSDEIVTAATLNLKYSYSPALLPDLSHLKVTINGVTVGTLPADKANAGKLLSADLPIDPRLVTDYNQLNLQLIGHYTRECEDPDHSSLWANVDAATSLSLTTTPLALANNLALLPVPFFDVRDTRRLELPFYFPQRPDNATLQAAGVVASWFGTLAGYRGAVFPASTVALPSTGNAVVFATPSTLPEQFATADSGVADIRGPTVAVVVNPTDPNGKLLLVLGRNSEDLQRAATALALRAPLTGAVARIGEVSAPAPRRPYDAPKWVSSEHPVRFGDLVTQPGQLNVSGYHPDLIRVGLQLPPDLFVWERDGIPVALKYRYTVPDVDNKSALNVSINESFVTTLPLTGRPFAESTPRRWWNSLGARGSMPVHQDLTLPVGAFSANSQLRFHFFSIARRAGVQEHLSGRVRRHRCRFQHRPERLPPLHGDAEPGRVRQCRLPVHAPGRSVRIHHRAARQSRRSGPGQCADPARTLRRLHRVSGAACADHRCRRGAAACRPRSVAARQCAVAAAVQAMARTAAGGPGRAGDTLCADRLGAGKAAGLPVLRCAPHRPADHHRNRPATAAGRCAVDGLRIAVEVRPQRGRVPERRPSQHEPAVRRLVRPDPAQGLPGQRGVAAAKKVISLVGNQTYYVGHLPLPTWLRWYFSHHPVWLALTVVLLALLLALAARVLLRRHAAERLNEGGSA